MGVLSFIYRFFLRQLIFIYNISYLLISKIVIRLNNGIHPKHQIINYHKFFIDNISNSDSVLDIGCNNGLLAYELAGKAKEVIAIDIDKKNIEYAKKKYQKQNLNFIVGDAIVYDFDRRFDKVVLSNVLEHLDNRVEFLKKLKEFAPIFLIRVPLITRSWLAAYLKENGYEYRLDRTHKTEYTEEELFNELKSSGLNIVDWYVKWGELYGVAN